MLKKLVEDVVAALATIDNIRYVGEDWGQLGLDSPAVRFPCALVEIDHVNYGQMGSGGITGECSFRVTLADQPLLRTSQAKTTTTQVDNLSFFDITDCVLATLSGMSSPSYSPMRLDSLQKDYRNPQYRIYQFVFTTGFTLTRQLQGNKVENIKIKQKWN